MDNIVGIHIGSVNLLDNSFFKNNAARLVGKTIHNLSKSVLWQTRISSDNCSIKDMVVILLMIFMGIKLHPEDKYITSNDYNNGNYSYSSNFF
ncbi:MAG: hypothetical protein WCL14_03140 [Bacteroidota bacterium]